MPTPSTPRTTSNACPACGQRLTAVRSQYRMSNDRRRGGIILGYWCKRCMDLDELKRLVGLIQQEEQYKPHDAN